MHTSVSLDQDPITVIPSLSARIVPYGSAAYQEACQLQALRYARACAPKEDTFQQYLGIVNTAPLHALPLAVARQDSSSADVILGAARLELPTATTIEAIMHFHSGSLAATTLSHGTFGEIGAFAAHPDLDWDEVLDVLDTIAGAVVQLAKLHGIEYLWVFPRYSMMSLVLADIPGLLPAYHFTLCADVAGWNEESTTLQKIRKLRMKDLPVDPWLPPTIYQITPTQCAADLEARLALREQRRQAPKLPNLLRAALRRAHQQMTTQITAHNGHIWKGETTDATNQELGVATLKRAG